MTLDRKPIFAAVRELRGGQGFSMADVNLLDRAIDEALASVAPVEAPPARTPAREAPFDLSAFFGALRGSKALGPSLSASEVSGCEAILGACRSAAWGASWAAYALATAVVETAGTMQPIKEIGGAAYLRRMYDIEGNRPAKARELGNTVPGDGAQFAGRGYVQLTGRANYAKASEKLGFGGLLIGTPDKAMDPAIAAKIMVAGMEGGWFTGRSLGGYLPAGKPGTLVQFKEARRIINGQDRAAEIAGYALEFQKALTAGGWR